MMKPRWIILAACISIFLLAGGNVWGDIGKPSEKKQIEIPGKFDLGLDVVTLKKAPWPTAYGKADRAMCSDLKGPGGIIKLRSGNDFFRTLPHGLGLDRESSEFLGILIGPGNRIYHHHNRPGDPYSGPWWATNGSHVYSCSYPWVATIKARSNFCLDTSGHIYTLESYSQPSENRYEVVCRIPDGTIIWNYRFGPSFTIDILTVGKYVYVVELDSHKFYLTAIKLNGTKAWSKGPYEPWANAKCAADGQGNLYLKFNRKDLGVWKFDDEGNIQWKVPLTYKGASPLASSASEQVGLICVDDGRLLVDDLEHHYSVGNYNADPYLVINPDGTIFKSGNLGEGTKSTMACYGSDGRLYVATIDNKIKCFNNWNQQAWFTQLPFGNLSQDGKIVVMILDSENIIYLVYVYGKKHVLYMLDPLDGHMLGSFTINASDVTGDKDFLAIGDDEELIWFNNKGEFGAFEATTEDLPIHWEAEDFDHRFEVIERTNGDD